MSIKNTLRLATPPIIYNVGRKIRDWIKFKKKYDFRRFIESLSPSQSAQIPQDLSLMLNAYFKYGSNLRSSKYWHYLNTKNIEQLISDGFDNFKQTVGQNYTLYLGVEEFSNLVAHTNKCSSTIETTEIFKRHAYLGFQESIQLNLISYALVNHYLSNNRGGVTLEEPIIGNPPYIVVGEKRITSDLMLSLSEYSVLTRFLDLQVSYWTIASLLFVSTSRELLVV